MTMDRLFTAFHLFGGFVWIGGLIALTVLLGAASGESDLTARKRLASYARKAGMIPDIGATLAIIFGLHGLFRFQLYKFPYMHVKLLLVVFVIGLHGFLRARSKRAAQSGDVALPAFVRPLLALVVLGITVVVITKIP